MRNKNLKAQLQNRNAGQDIVTRVVSFALHACFVVIFLSALAPNAHAQLPRDVRDMFEAMLDDLEDDLRAKFAKAIKDDTATVEFTADEFIRFRNDPINPFEGLDRIEVKEGGGNIALQFQLPSIRNRVLKPFERQDPDQLERLNPVVSQLIPSVVAVMSDKRQIALGTVVDANGYVVTKASEVNSKKYLTVVASDGKDYEAKLVHQDKANDIAVLKVDATLQSIEWKTADADMGQFIVLPAPDGNVFSMGTYSVGPRTTQTGRRALLGVNPDNAPGGVSVDEIEGGTAASNAGLINGDVITAIDGQAIEDVDGLVNAIRKNRPGDTIRINYLRAGVASKTTAVLDSVDLSGEQAKRYKMMSRLGAIPSKRADNFPAVFQHDAPLFPEQCGGPVVDLSGNILGINIARNGRAATYAVPLENVQQLFRQYLREAVAARE